VDPIPEGARARAALVGLSDAAGIPRTELEDRLAHPYRSRAPRPPLALYLEDQRTRPGPQTPWVEIGESRGIDAILWGCFSPIVHVERLPYDFRPAEPRALAVTLLHEGRIIVDAVK
jgi:hypothetical protein